ncbi:zinc finger MYND domain-containing protein [bacterium]|nr:zinc finger MYND domain-containing protein [bacterium]
MNNAPDTISTTCANCGKGEESSGDLKTCTACKLVKYCNRDCQIAHRPMHKKACKKRAAELHYEALFKDHPPNEECPICLLPLPHDTGKIEFKSCCGKIICHGCIHAMIQEARGRGEEIDLCAFCRKPYTSSDEEENARIKKLMKANNADAFYNFAGWYARGVMGMPQDFSKARELYLKAGELGCSEAYYNLGVLYENGRGVEMDKKKAKHFYELAAMNGDVYARHNLGCMEGMAGNNRRAMKHYILSARDGHNNSLDQVKDGFKAGMVTKDEYANTLRAHQRIQDEMKSDDRDKAEEFQGM